MAPRNSKSLGRPRVLDRANLETEADPPSSHQSMTSTGHGFDIDSSLTHRIVPRTQPANAANAPINSLNLSLNNFSSRYDNTSFKNPSLPLRPPKEYCSFWLRRGECDYTQQGCKYKHEMPLDQETLERVGLKAVPRWFLDKPREYKEKYVARKFIAVGNEVTGGGKEAVANLNYHEAYDDASNPDSMIIDPVEAASGEVDRILTEIDESLPPMPQVSVGTTDSTFRTQLAVAMPRVQLDFKSDPAVGDAPFFFAGRTFKAEALPFALPEMFDCVKQHLAAAQLREQEAKSHGMKQATQAVREEEAKREQAGVSRSDWSVEVLESKAAAEALRKVEADMDVLLKAASIDVTEDEQADADAVRYTMRRELRGG